MPDGPIYMPDGSRLEQPDDPLIPLDLDDLLDGEDQPTLWLDPGRIPEASRVLMVGPAGGGKSMYGQAFSASLTRQGLAVAYYDGENPRGVVRARLQRLGVDRKLLRYFHKPGIDLESAVDRHRILYASYGCALVVFDTLSSYFTAEQGDNPAFSAVDSRLFVPLTTMGCAVLILDHTGQPGQTTRKGIHLVRGQSAKAQKADVVAVVEAAGADAFSVEIVKNSRFRSDDDPKTYFRVVDGPDNTLSVEAQTPLAAASAATLTKADTLVQTVLAAGPAGLTQTELSDRLGVSRPIFRAVSAVVLAEEPARVRCVQVSRWSEPRQRMYASKLWVSAEYADTLDVSRTQGGGPAWSKADGVRPIEGVSAVLHEQPPRG